MSEWRRRWEGWPLPIIRALGPQDGVGVSCSLSMSSNAPLPQDFHSHLTRSEVVGYLGGRWDINSQSGYLGLGWAEGCWGPG